MADLAGDRYGLVAQHDGAPATGDAACGAPYGYFDAASGAPTDWMQGVSLLSSAPSRHAAVPSKLPSLPSGVLASTPAGDSAAGDPAEPPPPISLLPSGPPSERVLATGPISLLPSGPQTEEKRDTPRTASKRSTSTPISARIANAAPTKQKSPRVDVEHKAERLWQHLADMTGLRHHDSNSLPVEFKITLQVAEHMSQQALRMSEQAAVLDEVRGSVAEVKCGIEDMRKQLEHSFESFKDGLDDHHAQHHSRHVELQKTLASGKLLKGLNGCVDAQVAIYKPDDAISDCSSEENFVDFQAGDVLDMPKTLLAKQEGKLRPIWVGKDDSAVPPDQGQPALGLGGSCGENKNTTTSCDLALWHEDHHRSCWHAREENYWLRQLIGSNQFEWLCAAVIITNAFTIGVSAEESIVWAVNNPGVEHTKVNPVVNVLNKLYVTFYTIELLIKFWVFRCEFFTGANVRWNCFDLILVTSGLYDVLTEIAPINLGAGLGVTWLRVLRIVKTLKLLRVIRVMRFFQVLRLMVNSIAGSMMTLFWSILMISIMMYMFGLCFLNAVTMYLNDNPKKAIDDLVMEGIVAYWSSVPQSMMTLFWAVTGGADWEPLAMPIRAADTFFYSLFFFYIAFAAFAVLNVLTGMFVDTAMQVAQQDEENVAEELLQKHEVIAFRELVESKVPPEMTGNITFEFVEHESKECPIVDAFMRAIEIEHEDYHRVFNMMDADKSGMVKLDEFIGGCCRAKGSVNGLDLVMLINETKHIKKQFGLSMEFVESRFDEILQIGVKGKKSNVGSWKAKLHDAEMHSAEMGARSSTGTDKGGGMVRQRS